MTAAPLLPARGGRSPITWPPQIWRNKGTRRCDSADCLPVLLIARAQTETQTQTQNGDSSLVLCYSVAQDAIEVPAGAAVPLQFNLRDPCAGLFYGIIGQRIACPEPCCCRRSSLSRAALTLPILPCEDNMDIVIKVMMAETADAP